MHAYTQHTCTHTQKDMHTSTPYAHISYIRMYKLIFYKSIPSCELLAIFSLQGLIYSNPTYYSSADEPVAYLDPVKAKSSAEDYETYTMMNVYEQPHNGDLYATAHIPDHYETSDSPANNINDNEVHLNEELTNSEPIYEDPGHIKENIYEWLEQREILKLDTKIVR